jgi:galactose mutarotase-like enzyme
MGQVTAELAMKTDTLRVTVLPALGGKIASLQWVPGDLELLQAPLAPYAPRNLTMSFDEGDASGIDECLPSVAGCIVNTPGGTVEVPDHGDFWRLEWECEQNGNQIRTAATGVSLPLRLERTLRLVGGTLDLEYHVTNVGDSAVEYVWSAHPGFAVDRGDRVVLPESVKEVRIEGSGGARLGVKGSRLAWPVVPGASGEGIDLRMAGGYEDETGDKIFAAAPPEGWAALERRQHGLRVAVRFDPRHTPWLGLWLCYGGWPERKANRQQCVAIEPCTAPVDSLAEAVAGGWARGLEPGESNEWGMQISVSRLS